MKKLSEINFKNKRVLVRIECNVPLIKGKIQDDTRLRETIPTLQYILAQNPQQVILIGHQGRPEGFDKTLTLAPHAQRLSELLGQKVLKLNDCGDTIPPENTPIVLLENVRFYAEKDKDAQKRKAFAEKIARLGDIYVNDAFGACHRAHASIADLPKLLPIRCAGLLLEKEIAHLTPLLAGYAEPLVLVIGGSKIDTKIDILKNYLEKAETFLIGGGIANTFLEAQGREIGNSLHEKDKTQTAREILEKAKCVVLPTDAIVAQKISPTAKIEIKKIGKIDHADNILDIGPQTVAQFVKIIEKAGTIIWNGPMGLFELDQFAQGSKAVAEAIAESKAYSLVGGGDTIAVCDKFQIKPEKFSHVSTGGGAMIEFLEGKILPGIAALED